ncbi:MAG: DNA repair protein RecO [Patescibacteria group bacterium]
MSWSALKTEAIVLTSAPFREADRRYSAFTRDFGKIEFIGRGARRGKAKLAAHLEPFAIVDLEIIKGRRSVTVISVERKHAFRSLMDNIDHRIMTQASLSLLDRHVRENDHDEILYNNLLDWMYFLDSQEKISRKLQVLLLGAFLLRLMQHLGYEVALENCVSCKQGILPLSFRWHGGRGGLVCSDCVQKEPEEWFAARQILEESVKILRFARGADYEDIAKTGFETTHVEDFARIVHDLMQYHLPVDSPVPFWQGLQIS